MEKRMKEAGVLMVVAVGLMLVQCGCESGGPVRTGFLTDYSRLRAESDTSLRYINEQALGAYSGFIVDEVKVHFFTGASAIEAKSEGKITEQELKDLTNYFHSAIVKAISDSGRKVVHRAGPGVARIRVALTDIKETGTLNVLPQASLLGAGIGGVAMEAEVVDSVTGKQVGAVVESRTGSRVPFSNLGDWGTAKGVMDDWAKRLQKHLEEAR